MRRQSSASWSRSFSFMVSRRVTTRGPPPPSLEVFYDGSCPMCRKEIASCMYWDAGRYCVKFTDISKPGFDAMAETGHSQEELNSRLHGKLLLYEDQPVISGVLVFRHLYFNLGLSPVYSRSPYIAPKLLGLLFYPTGWRPITPFAEGLYWLWTRFRLWYKRHRHAQPNCSSGSCKRYHSAL